MLTEEAYKDLWKKHFTNVGIRKTSKEDDNPNNCPNDYCEYLIREHMFEDYLDIFKGVNTRDHRTIKLCEEGYYDHPYFKKNDCLIDTPKLKYIMIGEAAPALLDKLKKRISISERNKIIECTYFYDIDQLGKTSWLSAPVKAFRDSNPPRIPYAKPTNSDKKINLLLELAKEGYLLIDLFPFSLKFSSNIRKKLNSKGVSNFFFKELQTKIDFILKDLNVITNSEMKVKVAFSGPPTVHHYLAYKINIGTLTLLHSLKCHTIPNNLSLKGSLPPPTQQPYFLCCTYDATNQNPHELFIRNAFELT
jgi:hypothetical protein